MTDDNVTNQLDEVRMEVAIQTIKDVLLRFEENGEGTRSVYELIGYILQDLLTEGLCPACLNEVLTVAFTETGADAQTHKDEDSVFH